MNAVPHSADHETALLAIALLDRDSFAIAKALVKPPEFYSPANSLLWSTFGVLHDRNEPIDQVTIRAELVRLGKLEAAGGDSYLLGIFDHIPDVGSVEVYARTVREHAKHRTLIGVTATLHAKGRSPGVTYEEFRADCERSIRDVTTAEVDGEPMHIGAVLHDVIDHAQSILKAGKGVVTGRSTGIKALDMHITGWNPGRLYVIGARPGMGKSALVTSTVMATKPDESCLAFSIEMPNRENGQRLIAAEIGMDLRDLAAAKISAGEWREIARGCDRLNKLPVYVDDRTRTLDQIVAKSRRFKAKHGSIGVVVIDYLQLIQGDRRLPREQQISEITRELKSLSKELECPIVLLSQLNRDCEKRPDRRPQIQDLRESGAIEQDADVVVFIYRRGYYAAQMKAEDGKPRKRGKWEPESDIAAGDDDGITELIIAKMRGGPTGVVKCLFQGPSARFVDLAQNYEAA